MSMVERARKVEQAHKALEKLLDAIESERVEADGRAVEEIEYAFSLLDDAVE